MVLHTDPWSFICPSSGIIRSLLLHLSVSFCVCQYFVSLSAHYLVKVGPSYFVCLYILLVSLLGQVVLLYILLIDYCLMIHLPFIDRSCIVLSPFNDCSFIIRLRFSYRSVTVHLSFFSRSLIVHLYICSSWLFTGRILLRPLSLGGLHGSWRLVLLICIFLEYFLGYIRPLASIFSHLMLSLFPFCILAFQ